LYFTRELHQDTILKGINRILREAVTSETEVELCTTCLAVAEEITQSKFGFVGELNRDSDLLEVIAFSDPGWAACRMENTESTHTIPASLPNKGLFHRVISSSQGFYTNKPAAHPDGIGIPEGHPPLTAFLGVPLIQDQETFGIVAVANRKGGYSGDDLAALAALAEPIMQVLLRRRAELALRDSEDRLQVAQRISHMGSWSIELTSNKRSWSDESYRIFEVEPEQLEASYEVFIEAVHPEDREAVDTAYMNSVANRTPYDITHRLLMKDGRIKYVHEQCETYYDAEDRPLRSIGTVQDITNRILTKRALEQEFERSSAS